MKYQFVRTFRLEKYLGKDYSYESMTWGVTEADSPEEAKKEVHKLADAYIHALRPSISETFGNPRFNAKKVEKVQENKDELPFKGDEFAKKK